MRSGSLLWIILGVLAAAGLALVLNTDGEIVGDRRVSQSDRIADAAAMILEQDAPVSVVDDNNALVGMVSRKNVIDALFAPDA